SYATYRAAVGGRVPLAQFPSPRPAHARSFRDWSRGFRGLGADACVAVKGTLHMGNLAMDLAARRRHRRYVAVEQLEPTPLPPRARPPLPRRARPRPGAVVVPPADPRLRPVAGPARGRRL